MEVKFDFALGETVKILANQLMGVVKGLWIDEDNIKKYFVEYVNNNDSIIHEWRKADEIRKQE